MDLRKGSDVPPGKRRCIRCCGRRKLYKTMGGWCFDNTGGTLMNCPMCDGKGHIDPVPDPETALGCAIEEKESGKKRRRKVKEKEF